MTEHVQRWCRGVASLALLVGLVVGVPAALLVLGGDPLPHRWDPAGLWAALLQPDDGTVLARLLTLVGWAAWLVFSVSLLVELVNLVRTRATAVVLPGLGGVQQWAAGLMLAVVALGGAAQLTSGPPAPTSVAARAAPDLDRAAPVPADRPPALRRTRRRSRRAGAEPGPGSGGPAATATAGCRHRPCCPRRAGSASACTSSRPGTTCGRWPSTTTAAGRTGAGSRRPTPTGSPAARTGCGSAGAWSCPTTAGPDGDDDGDGARRSGSAAATR